MIRRSQREEKKSVLFNMNLAIFFSVTALLMIIFLAFNQLIR